MKKESKEERFEMSPKKARNIGFGLRLVIPVLCFLFYILVTIEVYARPLGMFSSDSLKDYINAEDLYSADAYAVIYLFETYILVGNILLGICILFSVFAFLGRKYKWANVVSIIFGIPGIVWLVGIFNLAGGVLGIKAISSEQTANATSSEKEFAEPETVSEGIVHPVSMEGTSEPVNTVAEQDVQQHAGEGSGRQVAGTALKLDLYDTSIDSKTWKDFRKTASQEDLFVIALGARYRLVHTAIAQLIYAVGIILSVVIGLSFITTSAGLVILIGGYLLFSFLATKNIRYNETYSQVKRGISKEDRKLIEEELVPQNTAMSIISAIAALPIMYITIPYQAIMILIGLFAPNFVIAKSGILVSIPKGYDVGNLGMVGEYYASFDVLDDMMQTSYEENHKYNGTITNDMGCETQVHSHDGVTYCDDNGNSYEKRNGKLYKK